MAEKRGPIATELLKNKVNKEWQVAVLFTDMVAQPQLLSADVNYTIENNHLIMPDKAGVKNPLANMPGPMDKYPMVTMRQIINLDHVRIAQFLTGNEIVINQEAGKIITMD